MSVIVKGMSIPSKCEYCGFCRHYYKSGSVVCNAKNRILRTRKESGFLHLDIERPDWCPLIEPPKKHGRLIDADAFAERIETIIEQKEYDDLTIEGYDAPTIEKLLTVGEVLRAVIADLKGTTLYGYENTPTVIEAERE